MTADREVEQVALLALAYRELLAPATGGPDDLSLIAKMVADTLDDELELLFSEAAEHPTQLRAVLRDLAPVVPIRVEAMIHALLLVDLLDKAWARPFRARWRAVSRTMRVFEEMGLNATRPEVNAIAEEAYAVALRA